MPRHWSIETDESNAVDSLEPDEPCKPVQTEASCQVRHSGTKTARLLSFFGRRNAMAPTFGLQELFRDGPSMTSTANSTPAIILHSRLAGGGFLTRRGCTSCSRDFRWSAHLHPVCALSSARPRGKCQLCHAAAACEARKCFEVLQTSLMCGSCRRVPPSLCLHASKIEAAAGGIHESTSD